MLTVLFGLWETSGGRLPLYRRLFPHSSKLPLTLWADGYILASFFFLNDKILPEVYTTLLLVIPVLTILCYVGMRGKEKKIRETRRRLHAAEGGTNALEKDYHFRLNREARLEMELTGVKASQRRIRRSVEILLQENSRLTQRFQAVQRRYKKLRKCIDRREFPTDMPQQEEMLKTLLKERERLQRENEQLLKEKSFYRRSPAATGQGNRPHWMNVLPFADGDSLSDVKFAYRALAKAAHPDTGHEADEERMRKLNEAWEQARLWFENREG